MTTKEILARLSDIAVATRGDAKLAFVASATRKNLFARFFFARAQGGAWLEQAVKEIEIGGLDDEGVWFRLLYVLRSAPPEALVPLLLRVRSRLTSRMLYDVLKTALAQSPEMAWSLREFVLDYVKKPTHVIASDLGLYLVHVMKSPATPPAELLALLGLVAEFVPDPRKAAAEKPNEGDGGDSPDPVPRFDRWDYQQILAKAVPPMVEQLPFGVAVTLLRAVRDFLALKVPRAGRDGDVRDDASEIWCQRVDGMIGDHLDPDEALVHAFTLACETAYAQGAEHPDALRSLDAGLREDRWRLLDRVRFHCYAKFPLVAAEWIREELLQFADYRHGTYGFEFAAMIREAAGVLGEKLLATAERERIFEAIVNGPTEAELHERFGEHATPERFANFRRRSVAKSLWPFEPVLFGRYLEQFRAAVAESEPVTPGQFQPFTSSPVRQVVYKSPVTMEVLAAKSDAELITFLNEWSNAARNEGEWWVEVNYEGLAVALRQAVQANLARFEAFGAKWEAIRRPIYLRYALDAAREELKQNKPINMEAWFNLCRWITTHETKVTGEEKVYDASDTAPDWESARRAVVDFVGTCVEEAVKITLEWRESLADLLGRLATGHDRWLERGRPLVRPEDPLTDAINTTRGRALEVFVQFSSWVERQKGPDPLREARFVMERRFNQQPALVPPEYAQLGRLFPFFLSFDAEWATKVRDLIFPAPAGGPAWQAAFGTFVLFVRPHRQHFELLRAHYTYAVAHPEIWSSEGRRRRDFFPQLGQHVFLYYIWGLYGLTGADSLLAEFYSKTEPPVWGSLLQFVGQSLKNTPQLEPELAERCVAFFESRLRMANPTELSEFGFWLDAECLDLTWRLRNFIATLRVAGQRERISTLVISQLHRLLERDVDLVVETFAELVNVGVAPAGLYLDQKEVEPILKAGLNSAKEKTRAFAQAAQESLLNAGLFEYLAVGG